MAKQSRTIQTMVNDLAERLGRAVLIDDAQLSALYWSPQQDVDAVRLTSILRNALEPAALELVSRISKTRSVVITEAIPEIGMNQRICAPLIQGGTHIGYLWVLNSDSSTSHEDLAEVRKVADSIAKQLEFELDSTSSARGELISRLEKGVDEGAAQELIRLENLNQSVQVVADLVKKSGDWMLSDGITIRMVTNAKSSAASGKPLPLNQLGEAVRRARMVRLALKAGAKLDVEDFDSLQSWRLLLEAPLSIEPNDLQPNFELLTQAGNEELFKTIEAYFANNGDSNRTASGLHIHRTTLYYRLGRIGDLLGVNFQNEQDRVNLRNALRLDKIRNVLLQ